MIWVLLRRHHSSISLILRSSASIILHLHLICLIYSIELGTLQFMGLTESHETWDEKSSTFTHTLLHLCSVILASDVLSVEHSNNINSVEFDSIWFQIICLVSSSYSHVDILIVSNNPFISLYNLLEQHLHHWVLSRREYIISLSFTLLQSDRYFPLFRYQWLGHNGRAGHYCKSFGSISARISRFIEEE